MIVKTEPTFAHSKAFIFVMDHFVKLLKAGMAEQELCFHNAVQVAYVEDEDGDVIGAAIFDLDKTKRQAWIYLAAVAADHRSQGIYSAIYRKIEDIARNEGMKGLGSNVNVRNAPMLATAEKNGRQLIAYRVKKAL